MALPPHELLITDSSSSEPSSPLTASTTLFPVQQGSPVTEKAITLTDSVKYALIIMQYVL